MGVIVRDLTAALPISCTSTIPLSVQREGTDDAFVQRMTNEEIASTLERVADLLEAQRASVYRVRAYRNAVREIRSIDTSLEGLFAQDGIEALTALPAIGESIGSAIRELILRGRLRMLDRLEGESTPEAAFSTIAGIGEALARRIHEQLGVETLEELELAAHDGRLLGVLGFGQRRVRLVRDALESLLGRSTRRRALARRYAVEVGRPSARMLLEIDREYRLGAAAGTLPKIAPRRFNPKREAWLPILHVDREGYALTAIFSNTAHAHELGRTRDWVVIYFERAGREGQCTIVTETTGPLRGRRVIRGREAECSAASEQHVSVAGGRELFPSALIGI